MRHKRIAALLYLLPFIMLGLAFYYLPALANLRMSFMAHYDFFTGTHRGWTLANYRYLVRDPLFAAAVRQTVYLVLLVVPALMVLSLAVALGLRRLRFGARIMRGIYFLPVVTTTAVIAQMWNWIYSAQIDPLSVCLRLLHQPGLPWLRSPQLVMPAVALMIIWQNLGIIVLILLAALSRIPRAPYAAAALDGAGAWRQFTAVTLPALRPVLLSLSFLSIVSTCKTFTTVFSLFHGNAGPGAAGATLTYYQFSSFYVANRYPVAAASALVLILLVGALTALAKMLSLLRRWRNA